MRGLISLICILSFLLIIASVIEKEQTKKVQKTKMIVKNEYNDTISVHLTIGAPNKLWVNDVYGIFGIKTHGQQGVFTLAPGDSIIYLPPKAIQGNICFLSNPYQCVSDSGATILEFCLNNYNYKIPAAQETVEISCVAGINYEAGIFMDGGGIWTANAKGYDTITSIQNGVFGTNSGRVGVYPYGCDDCTYQSSGAPYCTIGKNENPQKYAICNVQRNASLSGGTVKFVFKKPIN